VLGDPELRTRLVRAGFDRAEGYTWERTAAATGEVLHDAGGV
jgi:hypothetical protein